MDAYKFIVSRAAAEWIVEFSKLYKMIKSLSFFTGNYDYDLDDALVLISNQNAKQKRVLRVQYQNVMREFGRAVSAQNALRKHFVDAVGNHARFFARSLERELHDVKSHQRIKLTLLDITQSHVDILSCMDV